MKFNMKFSQRNERRDWIRRRMKNPSRRRKNPLLFYERRDWISPKKGELSFVSKKGNLLSRPLMETLT